MAVEFITAVWKMSPHSGERLLVQLACADWANADGEFWPSYTEIADRARVTKRGAIGIMKALIEDGEIEQVEHGGHGPGSKNVYRFAPDYVQAVEAIRRDWAESRSRKGERRAPKEAFKGEPDAPLRVNGVHPSPGLRVNVEAPKGERSCCAYKEEPSWNRQREREDALAPACESNHTAEEPVSETAENSAPSLPVEARSNVTPFPSPTVGPNDDFSSPVETLAPSWSIGERFVLKACGLWESPTVEGNWRLLQAIRTTGAFVATKLDTVKRQGGTPDLWKEFWYEVLKRTGSPRPEWIAEQWEAYDRWLIQNHEPHRARFAQGVA